MKIRVSMKSISKRSRQPVDREFTVSDEVATLRALLLDLARQLWVAYETLPVDADWLAALSGETMEAGLANGKVGFGRKHAERRTPWETVSKRVVQSFEDGQFRVFHNDEERTELDDALRIEPNDRFLLVRLVMLAGSFFPY
jgi:hypothetical protein